ncbi:DeoR/GlpR family DNA-binding transcription regulator [Actinomadura xylanilytica]|uniref:DeoR/GlpR family DNA-binding transcription regulator n=1 Tax=Actinomadura xylanilytica TaxID=887459 RepID=UPI00255AB8A1|nr:DeoR/GlpR family DNA-binding transcription regulator [Actinomadura xylanilytica]MDL4772459.1 DeoR/GlpR family DNA-binding transcription regulator [Actinomadura xylanilytica]
MTRHERWNALLELLADAGRLSVEDAASRMAVSAATIRRDFDQLAQQQMLTRTRGGAVAQSVSYDLPLRYKSARHASEKQRIAAATAELAAPGSIIGLNGGTTTSEVARVLAARAGLHAGGGAPALTIVTNALNIGNELAVRPHVKIVLTGGVPRPQSYELTGPLATGLFDHVALDVAVLGVNGVTVEHGATCHNEGEADVNRLMAGRAGRVVVVADGSKVGRRAFAKICDTSEIDVLVTDGTVSQATADAFAEAGVEVIRT